MKSAKTKGLGKPSREWRAGGSDIGDSSFHGAIQGGLCGVNEAAGNRREPRGSIDSSLKRNRSLRRNKT